MTGSGSSAHRRLRVPIAAIDVPERLRPVDPAWAAAVGESMRETGLTHPIVVRPAKVAGRYGLVAGMHRLYAADVVLGWTEIDAEVRDLTDAEAKVVEIDENLMRRELSALDRAVFLAERKRLWEEAHPETKRGGDFRRKQRKSNDKNQTDIMSVWSTFSKEVAERTGLTDRTIRRATALAADLGPEMIARLRLSPIADNAAQLAALARLPDTFKAAALDPLAGGAPSLKAALKLAGMLPAQLPREERDFRALVGTWSRAGAKARRRFLAHIDAAYIGTEDEA